MKRTFIISAFILVVVTLILLKIFVFSDKAGPATGLKTIPVIPVECFIAKDTSVNYQIETVGTLRANEYVEIVSEINRKVVAIYMKEGAFVPAGALLFKLDDADIVARINKLTIENNLALANEAREKILLSKGGISQERFDEVSNLRQIIQAEIDVLKVDLAKTSIIAPFAGKIGLRNISVGALVNPEMTLATLQDIRRIKLDFSIPERYSHDLRAGSQISFRLDYLTNPVMAVIEAIEPTVDVNTRTLMVRAVTSNDNGALVPGTSARVTLILKEWNKNIFIPANALIPSIKGYSVFLIRKGLADPALVKTGLRNSDFVLITEGIDAGDTLVTTNLLRINKGSPLKIVKID